MGTKTVVDLRDSIEGIAQTSIPSALGLPGSDEVDYKRNVYL